MLSQSEAVATAGAEATRHAEERIEHLTTELNNERAQRAKALAAAERKVQEAEEKARAAESVAATAAVEVRTAASAWLRSQTEALRSEGGLKAREQIREAVAAAQQDAAAQAESQLAEQGQKLQANAESRLQKELATARRAAEKEGKDAYRAREENLEREKVAIEDELAATRRQLDEAHAAAAAAERRAAQAEQEAHRERERERELRYQAVEGRLGEIDALASGAAKRARAPDVDSPDENESEAQEEAEPTEAEAERAEVEAEAESGAAEDAEPVGEERLSIATATQDELRALGMSGIQAKRVINFREHSDGFESLEQLNRMPGFSEALLAHLKERLTL